MAENRSFRKELLKGIEDVQSLENLLNEIINSPEQKGAWNRRVVEMLIHACDYLVTNVRILKDRLKS